MNPKHHKEFKKGIAEQVGVHPEVVDDIIAFYYAKLRKNMSELAHPNIAIAGLGTFHLRHARLRSAVKKTKSSLGNLEKVNYNGYEKHLIISDKLELLEKALAMMDELAQDKLNFKNNKNGNK